MVTGFVGRFISNPCRSAACEVHRPNPTRTLRSMSQRSPKPCRHRGAAPYPRGEDPGARWEILCDTLTSDHKEPGCASLWVLMGTDGSIPLRSASESPISDQVEL